jgi:hypothetical protein
MFTKELTLTKMAVSIGGASIFETKIIIARPKSSLLLKDGFEILH